MPCADEPLAGTLRIYLTNNTYKTLKLTNDTSVGDLIEELCRRVPDDGSVADPAQHELLLVAPENPALRERRLLREDKPLQIQGKGFSFLFREIRRQSPKSEADSETAAELPVLAVDEGLRTGTLEKLLDDGLTWLSSTVILDEDRLWYSQGRSAKGIGGGMDFLRLCECDRVVESEDPRVLHFLTKGKALLFRARNSQERKSWFLAVALQTAIVKERAILLQAERSIVSLEVQHSMQQLARLEEFGRLSGVLEEPEARELFVDFARRDFEAMAGSWPQWLELEELLVCLGRPDKASPVWAFAEDVLFRRFQEHPAVQNRLCHIAAGIV